MGDLIAVEADGGEFLRASLGRPIHSSRLAALADNLVAALMHDDAAEDRWPSCGHIVFCDTLALQAFAVVYLGTYYAQAHVLLERLQTRLDKGTLTPRQAIDAFRAFGLYPKTECVIAQRLGMARCAGFGLIQDDVLRVRERGYAEPDAPEPEALDPKWIPVAKYLHKSLVGNSEIVADTTPRTYGPVRSPTGIGRWDQNEHAFKSYWTRGMGRFGVVNGTLTTNADQISTLAADFNGRLATDEQKAAAPVIDVLFGNQLVYEGVDLQVRTCAIHHLDLPWEPGRYTQRNGRAVRQGALHTRVTIYAYLTDGTVDFYRLGRMEGRRAWLESILKGGRAAAGLGGATEKEQIDLIVACTPILDQPLIRKELTDQILALRQSELQDRFREIEAQADAWLLGLRFVAVNMLPFLAAVQILPAGRQHPYSVPGYVTTRLTEAKAAYRRAGVEKRNEGLAALMPLAHFQAAKRTAQFSPQFSSDRPEQLDAYLGRGAEVRLKAEPGANPSGGLGLLALCAGACYVLTGDDGSQRAVWLGRALAKDGGAVVTLGGVVYGWTPAFPAASQGRVTGKDATAIFPNYPQDVPEADAPVKAADADVLMAFVLGRWTLKSGPAGPNTALETPWGKALGDWVPALPIPAGYGDALLTSNLTDHVGIPGGLGLMPECVVRACAERFAILLGLTGKDMLACERNGSLLIIETGGEGSVSLRRTWALYRILALVFFAQDVPDSPLHEHPRRPLPQGLIKDHDWAADLYAKLDWSPKGLRVWDAAGNETRVINFGALYALPQALMMPPGTPDNIDLRVECPFLLLPHDADWQRLVNLLRSTPSMTGAGEQRVIDLFRSFMWQPYGTDFKVSKALIGSERERVALERKSGAAPSVPTAPAGGWGSLTIAAREVAKGYVIEYEHDLYEVRKTREPDADGDVNIAVIPFPQGGPISYIDLPQDTPLGYVAPGDARGMAEAFQAGATRSKPQQEDLLKDLKRLGIDTEVDPEDDEALDFSMGAGG